MSEPIESEQLHQEALILLQRLIASPSYSKEEGLTFKILSDFFSQKNIPVNSEVFNLWVVNKDFDPNKPTVLLNSHHDTVKPNDGYSKNPHEAIIEEGKLYGLGSNDAGGCLVSLIGTFLHFYERPMPFNLILAATAEEEISGSNGIELILKSLPKIDLAIVGEPTLMQMAVAEKGLMVLDAEVSGKAGHAAREEGDNAIYRALDDLHAIRNYNFKKTSAYLGKSKVSATVIQAGTQHNVVPDKCHFTLDVRVTDSYTLEEALEELQQAVKVKLIPRSLRLNSSKIPPSHKILQVAEKLNIERYGSPTLSDQALIPYPSIKMGPGDSARSHIADEFIYVDEIKKGIEGYIQLLNTYATYFK